MATGGIEVSTRRDQLTIISDLLEIVQQPQRLTHILYKSNMSYGQLSKYLDELSRLELVETRTKPFRAFVRTEKGRQFHEMISHKRENLDSEHAIKEI